MSSEEEWRDVVGYEGLYMVSNLGRVKVLEKQWDSGEHYCLMTRKSKVLKLRHRTRNPNNDYTYVNLYKNGKMKSMPTHRLVGFAFIPMVYEKNFINHINGIKHDNRVENLEWCTPSENNIHACYCLGVMPSSLGKLGPLNKLSKTVYQYSLDGNLINVFEGQAEASRNTGIGVVSINHCCTGRQKTGGGFIWSSTLIEK